MRRYKSIPVDLVLLLLLFCFSLLPPWLDYSIVVLYTHLILLQSPLLSYCEFQNWRFSSSPFLISSADDQKLNTVFSLIEAEEEEEEEGWLDYHIMGNNA